MGKPNINKLYEDLFTIKEMLTEVINTSLESASAAESFGGEISRVVTNQLRGDVVPAINAILGPEGEGTLGHIISFLDSVPLAWIRSQQDDLNAEAVSNSSIPQEQPTPQQAPPAEGELSLGPADQQLDPTPAPPIQEGKKSMMSAMIERMDKGQVEEGSLDFAKIQEGYVRNEKGVQAFEETAEDDSSKRIIEGLITKSQKQSETKQQLKEADMLIGPYAPRDDVGGMEDWRSMVEGDIDLDPAAETDRLFEKLAGN